MREAAVVILVVLSPLAFVCYMLPNTKKMFEDMCRYYHTPIRIFGTKEELGRWSGKAYRASICILDEGFARALTKKISLNMEV